MEGKAIEDTGKACWQKNRERLGAERCGYDIGIW